MEYDFLTFFGLFPLDRGWGFGADVVRDAVDSANFVDDAIGAKGQHIVRKMRPISGHAIGAGDRTQSADVLVRALVPHHPNR